MDSSKKTRLSVPLILISKGPHQLGSAYLWQELIMCPRADNLLHWPARRDRERDWGERGREIGRHID